MGVSTEFVPCEFISKLLQKDHLNLFTDFGQVFQQGNGQVANEIHWIESKVSLLLEDIVFSLGKLSGGPGIMPQGANAPGWQACVGVPGTLRLLEAVSQYFQFPSEK